jgi:hypothetical protein
MAVLMTLVDSETGAQVDVDLDPSTLDWNNPNLAGVRLGRAVKAALAELAEKAEPEQVEPVSVPDEQVVEESPVVEGEAVCGNCGENYIPGPMDEHPGFCGSHCYYQHRGEDCPTSCPFCTENV